MAVTSNLTIPTEGVRIEDTFFTDMVDTVNYTYGRANNAYDKADNAYDWANSTRWWSDNWMYPIYNGFSGWSWDGENVSSNRTYSWVGESDYPYVAAKYSFRTSTTAKVIESWIEIYPNVPTGTYNTNFHIGTAHYCLYSGRMVWGGFSFNISSGYIYGADRKAFYQSIASGTPGAISSLSAGLLQLEGIYRLPKWRDL